MRFKEECSDSWMMITSFSLFYFIEYKVSLFSLKKKCSLLFYYKMWTQTLRSISNITHGISFKQLISIWPYSLNGDALWYNKWPRDAKLNDFGLIILIWLSSHFSSIRALRIRFEWDFMTAEVKRERYLHVRIKFQELYCLPLG